MPSFRAVLANAILFLLCSYAQSNQIAGEDIGVRLDANPTVKPNILILMVDDLGYNDLAINNGNSAIDTPHMDQLAREGVRFTRHYAASVCSPARVVFLTGLHPERVGFVPNGLGISPEIVTLPERLQEEGYTTWHIGKWHIGDLERTAWPDHQGFDHWFGFLNQWRLAGVHVDGQVQLTRPRYTDPWLEGDTEPGKNFNGHLENILTDKTIEVITELSEAQEPWFVNLWFYAPHGPVQPASEFAVLYDETDTGRFQALVNQLDTNIGRILAQLETLGVLDDTIVVMVSDNGGTNALLDNNAPFAGNKTTLMEGGLRTPLIIRWPDASLNGRVVADTVGIEDLYPTLLSAIDVEPTDNLDGVSFYDELQRQDPLPRRQRFWEIGGKSYGVLSADGRWRLFQSYPWGVPAKPALYDFEQNPAASQPVDPAPPAQLARLAEDYQAWYRDVHSVDTAYVPGPGGSGVLTGTAFLRTPGFGEYTFGIGVRDEPDGQIAAQAGIWSLRRTGDTIQAKFGDLLLSGDIKSASDCHSKVISGVFAREVSASAKPEFTLALYIDGVEAQSATSVSILPVTDTTIETVIGDPGILSKAGARVPPIILNTALTASTAWTIESFSQALCGDS